MADRQKDAIAPAGPPHADRADQATATSRENALNTSESRDAAQDDTTTDDAMEKALSASLELLNNNNKGIDQGTSTLPGDLLSANTADTVQDGALNANTIGESDQALLAALLSDQQTGRVVSDPSIDALSRSESSRMTQYHTFDGTAEEDIDKNISGPVETPEVDDIQQPTSEPLSKLSGDAHSLGAQLESIYQTTSSPEMKQIIACLVHLDTAVTRQTHLNNLHEAHTAKNFREQRHLNKDRKLRLLETIQNVNRKFARFDAERMETEKLAKQCEIRVNSYGLQLQGLKDRVKMLADGGEWMEAELTKISARFEVLQEDNDKLKKGNKHLKDKVRGLEEEVDVLKDRDAGWERRTTALEEFVKDKKENDSQEVSVDKEPVLDAVRFSVGNYRIFSIYY
ncbi:hypothetical protein KCV07_g5957, partial [Aureobasidium melanogenum]